MCDNTALMPIMATSTAEILRKWDEALSSYGARALIYGGEVATSMISDTTSNESSGAELKQIE